MIPKMHKNPTGFRFIIASRKNTLKGIEENGENSYENSEDCFANTYVVLSENPDVYRHQQNVDMAE